MRLLNNKIFTTFQLIVNKNILIPVFGNRMEAVIKIKSEDLIKIFPHVNSRRGVTQKMLNIKGFVYTYNTYANYFGINTPLEVRHFIAQVAHESDQWNAYEEYASGKSYEGRKDLGNVQWGDGVKYKGRGPFQITGKANYREIGKKMLELTFLKNWEKDLFKDDRILKHPELLADPVWGTLAAFIYWNSRHLNELCKPDNQQVVIRRFNGNVWYDYKCYPLEAITRRINGGLNGYSDRKNNYEKLKKII